MLHSPQTAGLPSDTRVDTTPEPLRYAASRSLRTYRLGFRLSAHHDFAGFLSFCCATQERRYPPDR